MKKSLFTTGCCVAALMSATTSNADIIFGGVVTPGPDAALTINNHALRFTDLTITAANGGGIVTRGGKDQLFGQTATNTIDIQAGEFNAGTTTGTTIFLGNSATGNHTFNISGGVANFAGSVGIGRQGATGVVTISGGAFNVAKNLSFNDAGGSGGILDFTIGSTGTLTVGGTVQESTFEAAFDLGLITVGGVAGTAGTFSDFFEVSGTTLSLAAVPEPA